MKFKLDKKYTNIGIHIIILALVLSTIIFCFINLNNIFSWTQGLISGFMGILSPIILGLVFAYLLDPLVDKIDGKLKKERKNRLIATALTYVILLVFIIGVGYLISSSFSGNNSNTMLENIIKAIQDFTLNFNSLAEQFKNNLSKISIGGVGQGEDIAEKLIRSITIIVQRFGNAIVMSFRRLGGYLVNIFMGLFISFYFLMDKKVILREWNKFLDAVFSKKITTKLRSFGGEVNWVVSGYIRGQLIDVVIMGILISIVLLVLKIDYAIVIGILSGFANLIPMVGSIVATVLAVIVALSGGSVSKAVYALIILVILQQIDGNIITPKVVGKNVNLHPLMVLLAIFIFGSLYGIPGMVIAVPTTALIKHFYNRFIENRLREKNIED